MKRKSLIAFFFTIYIAVVISNLPAVFALINPNVSLVINYGAFLCLLVAFIYSSPFTQHNNNLVVFFKKNLKFSGFILLFYAISVIVSMVYMNYDPLFTVLPSLIRCTISLLVFNWLFSYILYNGLINTYIKIFVVIFTVATSSIFILKFSGVELSYLVDSDLQVPNSDIIGRSSGFFINANVAAQFALYAIVFLLYYLQKKQLKFMLRILIYISLAMCIYSVFLTFSTTGFINLLLIFAYFIFMKYDSKMKFIFHSIVFVVVFQVLLLGLLNSKDALYTKYDLPKIQQEKIDNMLNVVSFNDSKKIDYSYRDQLIDRGLAKIEVRPYFGYGAGEFTMGILNGFGIHNNYLQIIGEAGIFMLIFYLITCFNLLKRCYNTKTKAINFLLTSIVLISLIYQLTTHGIFYNESMLFILIMVNAISIYQQDMDKRKMARHHLSMSVNRVQN